MNWNKLFSASRLNRPGYEEEKGRNAYQKDLDRIHFSGSFRRLANKTQVHPMAENDHIHNRLTHSIETGSVGRSIGTIVGAKVSERENIGKITVDDFGYVVQAACLAHDIGNPPFGHSGEKAISQWFSNEFTNENSLFSKLRVDQQKEFSEFEGNAQGFRILTQLENEHFNGGLQLTHAVLATFSKYPRVAHLPSTTQDDYIGAKKHGYLLSEKKYFDDIAKSVGLIERGASSEGYWCRHPLAFLVEAADDICYNIVDLEDAVLSRDLSFEEVETLLCQLIDSKPAYKENQNNADKISYLRALSIGNLVKCSADAFMDNYKEIMSGNYSNSLIEDTKYKEVVKEMKGLSSTRIFTAQRKTELEIAGHQILFGLLDIYKEMLEDLKRCDWQPSLLPNFTAQLMRYSNIDFNSVNDLYSGTQLLTDYISGMTDRYAAETYRKLSGRI